MTYSLTWLADVLRAAGLKVVEQPGWKTRGRGDVGKVVGVLCHHTAGALTGNAPSLSIVTKGRPDLAGPLSQLVLGRDGTFYVVAAGRANHAGAGDWRGCKAGNTKLIGIEAENTGLANDNPWPAMQLDAYARGVAAILKHIGAGPEWCAGHLEYAPRRKVDPSFSVGDRPARLKAMADFRAHVAALMASDSARVIDQPANDGPGDADADDDADADAAEETAPAALTATEVTAAQSALKAMKYHEVGEADGKIGSRTVAAVAAFMHDRGMFGAPVLDRAMLAAIGRAKDEMFTRPIGAERAEGEPESSRIVASAERQGIISTSQTLIGGGGVMAWLLSKVDLAQGYVDSYGAYLKPLYKVVGDWWPLIVLMLGAWGIYEAAKTRRARVEDHREGVST
jgi:hypothetical protein